MQKIILLKGWLFLIVFSVIPLSSCIYDREMAYLNDQIVALNRKVTKLEESTGSDLDSRLQSISTSQSGIRVEIDQIKGEAKALSGRVEDNEHIIKRAVERDLGEQDSIQMELADLKEKVTALEGMVKRHQEYLGLEPLSVREGKKQGEIQGENKQAEPVKTAIKDVPKTTELGLYDSSLASFRGGKFEEAMDGFKAFLKKYPKSDRADNAQFWIGESYMSLKQYEQAILAYQGVIKKYPKGNKVANAMLRQAVAFLEIKDKTSSKLLLKKIIKKYPKSSEAKIAKRKLKQLR